MKHKQNKKTRAIKWLKKHKSQVGLISICVITVIIGGSIIITSEINQNIKRTDPSGDGISSKPTLKFEASPLTGRDVSPELAKRPVTAVIVENSPEARPQSGLNKAGVIYEAIAEGGITRFVVFYQEEIPAEIGPIRSLRPYFIDWILQFDATISHVGGSSEALAQVRPTGIKDIDEFNHTGSFWRDGSRYAPHNVYTSGKNIREKQKQLGFTKSDFKVIPRKDPSAAKIPTATSIDVGISSYLYNPNFKYNKNTNTYDRSVAGAPHKDRATGDRISPDVVVVLEMAHRVKDDVGHLAITTTGSGNAWIFQNGISTKVIWKRSSRSSQIQLVNKDGKTVKINKGQVWFSVLPAGNSVTY